jgi:tetratricopeptide (TPR) repeat protein
VPPIWGRPIVAVDALAFYLRQIVAPIWLGIDYGRSPGWLWNSQQIAYTWIVPAALAVVVALFWPRTRWATAGGLILIAALLPVLGLVPFNFQSYSTVADHYLYVAMLGPALVLGWAVQNLVERFAGKSEVRNAVLTVAGAYVALLGLRAHIQTWTWRDSRALFTHTLRVNPRSVAANTNLGSIYINDATGLYSQGKPERAKARLEQAERLFRTSLSILPNDADAHYNLGRALLKLNRTGEAIESFRKSIEISPDQPDVHTELGRAYARIGQDEAAVREFEEALRINPSFQPARQNLAEIRSRRPDLR